MNGEANLSRSIPICFTVLLDYPPADCMVRILTGTIRWIEIYRKAIVFVIKSKHDHPIWSCVSLGVSLKCQILSTPIRVKSVFIPKCIYTVIKKNELSKYNLGFRFVFFTLFFQIRFLHHNWIWYFVVVQENGRHPTQQGSDILLNDWIFRILALQQGELAWIAMVVVF